MAHFAELDDTNHVLSVIVVGNDDCTDENGDESEEVGVQFCIDLLGGRWIQTSYNGRMRGKYAAVGDLYDVSVDEFVNEYTPEQLAEQEVAIQQFLADHPELSDPTLS